MSPLRALFLTPQLPYPPQQGSALRNFYLIKGLAEAGIQIDLLSFATAAQVADPASGGPLRQLCPHLQLVPLPPRRPLRARLATLLRGQSDMADRLAAPEYAAALQQMLAAHDYDIIQIEGIEMARYGLQAMDYYNSKQSRPHFILDEHNAEYLLQKRVYQNDIRRVASFAKAIYSFVQYRRLMAYEKAVSRRVDKVIAVSPADKAALVRLDSSLSTHITVISNGVDTDEFNPSPAPPPANWPSTSLVFTGVMDYRPNIDAAVWFVNEVWPRIRATSPAAQFYIVGARPAPAVQALASAPGVTVTGAVDDVKPYIRAATLYVVPMRVGGGVRLKLLQAMAMAKPILTTTLGAEGVEVVPQRDVAIADDAITFAARAVDLLCDNDARLSLAQAARVAVNPYAWQELIPIIYKLYLSTIS